MRYSNALLPFVATAAAIVIPDEATAKQLVVDAEQKAENAVSSWRDQACRDANSFLSTVEDTLDNSLEGLHRRTNKLRGTVAEGFEIDIGSDITDFLSPSDYVEGPHGPRGPHGPHGPGGRFTNLTVYQTIHASNHTTKFAKLLDDFPEMVERLNGTTANITIFVPTDDAFEKLPDHVKNHKPPKEFVEAIVKYHVLPGFYTAGRIITSHTLPTAFEEEHLGGRPQRLRVSVGLFGVKLNFYSKLVYANLITSNGAVHAVDSILVPPPPARALISSSPTTFSTLELAFAKTHFAHHLDKHSNATHPPLTGLTFFAPTNVAFKKLGPRANAFLFNSPRGLKYLRALLAYHLVVNETLYSDAYYGHQKTPLPALDEVVSQEGEVDEQADGHFHIDLPTLLGDKHIGVDIARWRSIIRLKLNGRVNVAVQDGVSREGVIQVVDSVLVPRYPPKYGGMWHWETGDKISVHDLIERLEPWVEEEEYEEVEDTVELEESEVQEEDVQVEL